jgi:hypothetical protein
MIDCRTDTNLEILRFDFEMGMDVQHMRPHMAGYVEVPVGPTTHFDANCHLRQIKTPYAHLGSKRSNNNIDLFSPP